MALFEKKVSQPVVPQVTDCEKKIADLEQQKTSLIMQIGLQFLANNQDLAGTPYEEKANLIVAIDKEILFEEKKKLAVQGLRKCEKCGNVLVLDSSFCNKCGEKLEPLFAEEIKEQKICPNCGSSYDDGALFCTTCGNKLG